MTTESCTQTYFGFWGANDASFQTNVFAQTHLLIIEELLELRRLTTGLDVCRLNRLDSRARSLTVTSVG